MTIGLSRADIDRVILGLWAEYRAVIAAERDLGSDGRFTRMKGDIITLITRFECLYKDSTQK